MGGVVYLVQHNYPYWIVLGLALLAGGVLVRIFTLFHDCCHGSFFASRRANTIIGYVTGVLTFTPFEDWRRAHNMHHATTADLDRRGVGDVWTMTVDEYLAAPRRRRVAYRLYRHPFITLGLGSAALFLILHRFPTKGAGKRELRSVFRTNLALLLIAGLLGLVGLYVPPIRQNERMRQVVQRLDTRLQKEIGRAHV